MIIRGKIHKKPGELKTDKILELVNSKNYMEAIDLLAESIEKDDSLSSKAEEALQMIAGLALKEVSSTPGTSEDHEKLKYNGNCIVKISTIISLPPPIQALGWYLTGVGSGGLGDHDEAISCFDKAIEIQPSGAAACEAWKDKATVLFSLKKYKEALKCADKALGALDDAKNVEGDVEGLRRGVRKLRERCRERLSNRVS